MVRTNCICLLVVSAGIAAKYCGRAALELGTEFLSMFPPLLLGPYSTQPEPAAAEAGLLGPGLASGLGLDSAATAAPGTATVGAATGAPELALSWSMLIWSDTGRVTNAIQMICASPGCRCTPGTKQRSRSL